MRPGRLVGGPYTGTPDVASLLKMDEVCFYLCVRIFEYIECVLLMIERVFFHAPTDGPANPFDTD